MSWIVPWGGGVAFPASARTWKEAGGFLPQGMMEVCGLFTCGRTWRAVGMFTEAGAQMDGADELLAILSDLEK